MSVTLEGKLVVALSSRALFDFEEENRVFENLDDSAYMAVQLERMERPAKPGVAFPLVKKLLTFNADGQHRVEVVILSRNDPVSGLRVFRSAKEEGLALERGVSTRGRPPYHYLSPLGAHLFLSADEGDVRSIRIIRCLRIDPCFLSMIFLIITPRSQTIASHETSDLLFTAHYMIPFVERFRPVFEKYDLDLIVPEVQERMEEADLLRYAGQFDGAICGDDRYTERVIRACAPRLKVISKWGTGIDSIDAEACSRYGVKVCRTLNAFTLPVADTVLGYILAFARRQPWMDRAMKSGKWEKMSGRSLSELALGVIGVGNIGKAVTCRARAFGMKVYGTDIVRAGTARRTFASTTLPCSSALASRMTTPSTPALRASSG